MDKKNVLKSIKYLKHDMTQEKNDMTQKKHEHDTSTQIAKSSDNTQMPSPRYSTNQENHLVASFFQSQGYQALG